MREHSSSLIGTDYEKGIDRIAGISALGRPFVLPYSSVFSVNSVAKTLFDLANNEAIEPPITRPRLRPQPHSEKS